jgi:hypothetical protein
MADNIPTKLPRNTMGIKLTPELLGMYFRGLDAQRASLGREKKKARRVAGLESKLRDPNSQLTKQDKNLLKIMLSGEEAAGRTDEGALMGLRQQFPQF